MAARHLQEPQRPRISDQILPAGLVVFGISIVALGVGVQIRAVDAGFLLLVSLIALGCAWILSRLVRKSAVGGLFLILMGLALIFILVGDLYGLYWTWVGTWPEVIRGLPVWVEGIRVPETAAQIAWLDLVRRIQAVGTDLGLWVRSLIGGNPIFNVVSANFMWGLALWLAASWAGWIRSPRWKPLSAILPGGVILAVVLSYTQASTLTLLAFLFTSLILMSLHHYLQRERSWRERGMDYPNNAREENYSYQLRMTAGILVLAVFSQAISLDPLRDWVRVLLNPPNPEVESLFDSLGLDPNTEPLGALAAVVSGGLPRRHLIGSGPELSQQVVMRVKIVVPEGPEPIDPQGFPLYWRSITYDRYTGRGWVTSEVELQVYDADDLIRSPTPGYNWVLKQEYFFEIAPEFIYAAGDVLSLDREYGIAWRVTDPSESPEPAPLDFFAGSIDSRTYSIFSELVAASPDELRDSMGLYPTWISERYLRLPDSVPDRVMELARDLTRDSLSPYEKARAIETYLRTYEYELDLPAPSRNRDLVDNFLFDLKKGYCDYYASAMVVLARAAGVPARLAIGYTRGEYDPEQQSFVVTEENAHSWPEIYFEGLGWVPFEPTVAQPEINRADLNQDQRSDFNPEFQGPGAVRGVDELLLFLGNGSWSQWLGWSLLGILGVLSAWYSLDRLVLRLVPPSRALAKLIQRLYRQGTHLGVQPQMSETPYEYTAVLEHRIATIQGRSRWAASLEDLRASIRILTEQYVQSRYSPTPPAADKTRQIIKLWPGLARKLILARVIQIFQKNFRRQNILRGKQIR